MPTQTHACAPPPPSRHVGASSVCRTVQPVHTCDPHRSSPTQTAMGTRVCGHVEGALISDPCPEGHAPAPTNLAPTPWFRGEPQIHPPSSWRGVQQLLSPMPTPSWHQVPGQGVAVGGSHSYLAECSCAVAGATQRRAQPCTRCSCEAQPLLPPPPGPTRPWHRPQHRRAGSGGCPTPRVRLCPCPGNASNICM